MLVAFHDDKKIKDKYLKRVQDHYKADEIIQGTYWERGKGCAVGCTVEKSSNAHEAMEKELGIPKEVALLEDVIFEELSNGEAKKFPLKFLKAVNVGADLSSVVPKFVIWQFEDKKYGLKNIKEVKEDEELLGLCQEVVDLYKRDLKGKKATEDEYYQLYLKIDGARAWAWARAWAGAGAGARAGAWALARAGASRAWAWAWAWARAGAGAVADYDRTYKERVETMADKFIELIKECK